MVETICNKLTLKIRKEMPEIDDEKAEIINYGLQLLIGEIPKFILLFLIAYGLGVFELSLIVLLIVTPYRITSGGAHFTTHIECIIATSFFYSGNAILSKNIVLDKPVQYVLTVCVWVFAMLMIKKYAPADTEAVPILRLQERKVKRRLSYLIMTIMLIASIIIKNTTISNIILIGTFLQTFALTKPMYKIARNRYGYSEAYKDQT